MRRVFNYIFWISASACMLFAGWLLLRIFICDQFVVPSESMMPTLLPGDRILVNKLLAGSRIYSKLEFRQGVRSVRSAYPASEGCMSMTWWSSMPRTGYDRDRIEFRINYVYAKRCVGTPGDSIAHPEPGIFAIIATRGLSAMPENRDGWLRCRIRRYRPMYCAPSLSMTGATGGRSKIWDLYIFPVPATGSNSTH